MQLKNIGCETHLENRRQSPLTHPNLSPTEKKNQKHLPRYVKHCSKPRNRISEGQTDLQLFGVGVDRRVADVIVFVAIQTAQTLTATKTEVAEARADVTIRCGRREARTSGEREMSSDNRCEARHSPRDVHSITTRQQRRRHSCDCARHTATSRRNAALLATQRRNEFPLQTEQVQSVFIN